MGLLDIFGKAAEYIIPAIIDSFQGQEGGDTDAIYSDSTNIQEIVAECDEFLKLALKMTIDDIEEILNCLTSFDRRLLKLNKLDEQIDDFYLASNLNRLEISREKTIDEITKKYDARLEEISVASKNEKDVKAFFDLQEEWDGYFAKKSVLFDYNLKYMQRLANQAGDFIDG